MEPVDGRHTKASKFAPEEQDVISNMPDNVITNILDRLPIQDAVRTGILSRDWRFKWNMLTQLVFKPYHSKKCYTEKDISRLLLQLKGTVTKFVLYVPIPNVVCKVEDISLWILFLSRKGVKEFTLINHSSPFKLPTHLFSCLELKHLKLYRCHFCPPPSFRGFPNLSSLELEFMGSESSSVGDFINWCPLLEILRFRDSGFANQMKVNSVEIARFRDLKTLAFPLCMLANRAISSFSIFQHFGFLPKLQNLYLDFENCELVAEAGASIPAAFSSLKTLTLSEINLRNSIMLSCCFEIICGCPNLQTLKITADVYHAFFVERCGITSSEVDYNSMGQFQLRSVVFECFVDTEDVLCFMKCILAHSPLLKKVSIHPCLLLESDEKLMCARKLLKLHRASPIAEIDFY